jgi:hypothetical protein
MRLPSFPRAVAESQSSSRTVRIIGNSRIFSGSLKASSCR